MQEEELIQLLRNERTRNEGFRQLISLYKEPIYWHIRRMVQLHEDADDITQNTFVKVFRNIDSFKGNSKLYTWMYRIATNECMTFLSKNTRITQGKNDYTQDVVSPGNMIAADEIDAKTIIEKLMGAVAKLPTKQRLVFNMKYFDEMTYNEMSEVLDTSEGALKASYHHASQKIKSILKNAEMYK